MVLDTKFPKFDYDLVFASLEQYMYEKALELKIPPRNLVYVWLRNQVPLVHKIDVDVAFSGYTKLTPRAIGAFVGVELKDSAGMINPKEFDVSGFKPVLTNQFMACAELRRHSYEGLEDFFIRYTDVAPLIKTSLFYVGDARALDTLGVEHWPGTLPREYLNGIKNDIRQIYARIRSRDKQDIHEIYLDSFRNAIEAFATAQYKYNYSQLEEITNSLMDSNKIEDVYPVAIATFKSS